MNTSFLQLGTPDEPINRNCLLTLLQYVHRIPHFVKVSFDYIPNHTIDDVVVTAVAIHEDSEPAVTCLERVYPVVCDCREIIAAYADSLNVPGDESLQWERVKAQLLLKRIEGLL
jgi:hypothetical protein